MRSIAGISSVSLPLLRQDPLNSTRSTKRVHGVDGDDMLGRYVAHPPRVRHSFLVQYTEDDRLRRSCPGKICRAGPQMRI